MVVDDEGSAGYLLSTDDTLAFEAWAEREWWPPLRARYPLLDGDSGDARLIRLFHEPERTRRGAGASVSGPSAHRPAGAGQGQRTRSSPHRAAPRGPSSRRRVAGVHLVVGDTNTNAIGFYEHLGFRQVETEPGGILMGLRLE